MNWHLGDDINSTGFAALAFNGNLPQSRKSWVQGIMGQDPNVSTVNGARGEGPLWVRRTFSGAGLNLQSSCHAPWLKSTLWKFQLWCWVASGGNECGQPCAEGRSIGLALGALPCPVTAAAPGSPDGHPSEFSC